jgi:hypothetical protein
MDKDRPDSSPEESASQSKIGFQFQGTVDARNAQFIQGETINIQQATGMSTDEFDRLFHSLIESIQQAPPEKQPEAIAKAQELKEELAKGEKADDALMARLLDGLLQLAPQAIGAAVSLLNPIVGQLAKPLTKAILARFTK